MKHSGRVNAALLVGRTCSDLLMVCLSWALAYYVRFDSGWIPVEKGLPELYLYMKMMPFLAVIWFLVFSISGFYKRTGRHRTPFIESLDIIQSSALATVAFIAFTYIYEEYRYSRIMMVIFVGLHPWFIMAGRSAIRKFMRGYLRTHPAKRTLIIGGGDALSQAIELSRFTNFVPTEYAGVIVVGGADSQKADSDLCRNLGIPVLKTPKDWPSFLETHRVQTALFALPHAEYGYLESHLNKIADQVPDIKLLPDLARYTKLGAGIDLVNGVPVININDSPLFGMGSVIKRTLDVIGALALLVLFSPFMILAAILVPLTSPGPVFYLQERMGLDGRTFRIIKFRSMPVDAETRSGAVWATEHDARPTAFGKFLRKSNIDEMPQLFNVLWGEMSLVGPRPERPVFVTDFRKSVPGYMLRHKVKAGLT